MDEPVESHAGQRRQGQKLRKGEREGREKGKKRVQHAVDGIFSQYEGRCIEVEDGGDSGEKQMADCPGEHT